MADKLASLRLKLQQTSGRLSYRWHELLDGLSGNGTKPSAAVPFMITSAMREELKARGFEAEDIRTLKPHEAHSIIQSGMSKSDIIQQMKEKEDPESGKPHS